MAQYMYMVVCRLKVYMYMFVTDLSTKCTCALFCCLVARVRSSSFSLSQMTPFCVGCFNVHLHLAHPSHTQSQCDAIPSFGHCLRSEITSNIFCQLSKVHLESGDKF